MTKKQGGRDAPSSAEPRRARTADAAPPGATFFPNQAAFRAWLQAHHATAPELLVGFHKVPKRGATPEPGRSTLTWPQSVDEALCFGWIDGVRKSLGADAYTIRFTPRQPRSIWSKVNIARVTELTARGLVHPAGLAAFERRSGERSGVYSHEREAFAALEPALEARLRADRAALTYFEKQAPYYQRAARHWVSTAKRPETRARRLEELLAASRRGEFVKPLRRGGRSEE